MKKHKDIDIYDFSDYAEEVTDDALFKINGGAEVENSHEGVAGANVGDTLTRKDGTVVVINQGDINYAKRQLGIDENSTSPNDNIQPTVTGVPDGYNPGEYGSESQTSNQNQWSFNPDEPDTDKRYNAQDYNGQHLMTINSDDKENFKDFASYYTVIGQYGSAGTKIYDGIGLIDKSGNIFRVLKDEKTVLQYSEVSQLNNGKNVYFIYGYNNDYTKNQMYQNFERPFINDDIKKLENRGFNVIVMDGKGNNMPGTKENMLYALNDNSATAIIFSGHGSQSGSILTNDNKLLWPSDITEMKSNLQLVIFENCFQKGSEIGLSDNLDRWQKSFGASTNIVGWESTTSTFETISFNSIGCFDRQNKRLRDYLSELK